jgi:DeoR/GlpR family transcriptional regulator of sugar metabolism
MPSQNKAQQKTTRYSALLDQLTRSGPASVGELSRQLGVSEVSIRRDLEHLEQLGLLRRTHGGAAAITRPGQVSVYDARLLLNTEAKARIGQAAAARVRPGDIILLDSGTTILEVARHLPAALLESGALTVVTRSLAIAAALRLQRRTRLIVLGGVYLHEFDTFVGEQVENALRDLHVHTLFIGTDGISAARGLTTDNVLEAGLYRSMARIADRVVVAADASKIGLEKLQATLALDDLRAFITDEGAPRDFLELLRPRGIEVIVAPGPPS